MPELTLSFATSSAILALSSFFGVFLMLQRSAFRNTATCPANTVLISFFLIGLTAIADTIHYGFSLHFTGNTEANINTVAFFITPPLFTASYVSIGWQLQWKARYDWIIFFIICALFWLAKSTHNLEFYRTILMGMALLVSFIALIRAPFRHPSSTVFFMIAILSYTMALIVISYLKVIILFLRVDFFHYLTALANLFLASGFFQLMRKGEITPRN